MKTVHCEKNVGKLRYNNGVIRYAVEFVYDVTYNIFGLTYRGGKVVEYPVHFETQEIAKEYIDVVSKESEKLRSFHYTAPAYPKCTSKIKKYYKGADVSYTDWDKRFVCCYKKDTHKEVESDKNLSVLPNKLLDCKEYSTEVVETIGGYASLPTDSEMYKLKSERAEVVQNELNRIKTYETFLKSLL